MFVKLEDGSALCVSAYKDVQSKVIVPPVNELWPQVEEFVASKGWVKMTKEEVAIFLKPEPTPESEHGWVKEELEQATVELLYHWTNDERASSTEEAWKMYARELRNYTTVGEDGNPKIREGEVRPSRPA